ARGWPANDSANIMRGEYCMTEAAAEPLRDSHVKVIAASSLGTVFEWYDFYLYGLLATIISAQFFSGVNETTAFILALAAFAAGLMLVGLRRLQGLALGGEYGGAAIYVAEHAPEGKRGFFTSFIQTTATLGLFAALLVVIGLRTAMGEEAFADWGWRIPFLIS